jgi:hypothetical protein
MAHRDTHHHRIILMLNNNYVCPICGYAKLSEPAYDDHGCASYDICPCCGNQFGYSDAGFSHEKLRREWIENGCIWSSQVVAPPHNWNPLDQLEEAGFNRNYMS